MRSKSPCRAAFTGRGLEGDGDLCISEIMPLLEFSFRKQICPLHAARQAANCVKGVKLDLDLSASRLERWGSSKSEWRFSAAPVDRLQLHRSSLGFQWTEFVSNSIFSMIGVKEPCVDAESQFVVYGSGWLMDGCDWNADRWRQHPTADDA